MSIVAQRLEVMRYRSFDEYALDLSCGVTVLVGHNAAGKTNLIEALQLLCAGTSFRKPSPAELVRMGGDVCRMDLSLVGEGRVIDLACTVRDGKRAFFRNGKKCTAAGVRGVLPCVLFCPDHLDMVKRSASVRRAALDDFGIQLNEQYAKLVSAYDRIVEQRNSLLKERFCSRELLEAWNESLAATGAALLVHRVALLDRVSAHLVEAYRAISGGEDVSVRYEATIGDVAACGKGDAARAAIKDLFLAALEAHADDELRRGMTLVGPHRDEIAFSIDGRDARSFASQGQQRSLVLAWKVAEVAVTRDILGRYPLLLLDDVMSELDAHRREAFMAFVADGIQTVITTTNLGYFTDEALQGAKVVRIGAEI